MAHVAHGTTNSCYVSLTRSLGVARFYALAGRRPLSPTDYGHVYEIELSDPLPPGLSVIDPVAEVIHQLGNPLAHFSYHHDGDNEFLLGAVSPTTMRAQLRKF